MRKRLIDIDLTGRNPPGDFGTLGNLEKKKVPEISKELGDKF